MLRPRQKFFRRGSVTVVVGDPFHPVDAVGRVPCNSGARLAPSSSKSAESQISGRETWRGHTMRTVEIKHRRLVVVSARPGVLKGDSPQTSTGD